MSRQRRLVAWIARPRAMPCVALLALALLSPCMAVRMLLDDHALALKAPAGADTSLVHSAVSMFTFTNGDPAKNAALMDEGALLPWWTEPRHLNAFFRPLSALTHQLDFWLWPDEPALMQAHSLFWFALLLTALAYVYRALEAQSAALCGLSFALYALDDAHGASVGWIANRNALIATALCLPALALHHRSVTSRSGWAYALALASSALGLCASEMALCVLGYLGAYALCVDTRRWRVRALSLLPYALLVAGHRAVYCTLSLGAFGSAAYHDPLTDPWGFVQALGFNAPVLLSSQWFLPLADVAFWGDVSAHFVLWLFACLTLLGLVCWLRPVLLRDRMARFWAMGMWLATIPICASLPGERLLLPVGIGASPLLARLIVRACERDLSPRLSHTLALVLGVWHLIVAPCGLPMRAYAMDVLARQFARLDAALPRDAGVRERTVVVFNAPLNMALSYVQTARAARHVPRPAHLYWLSSASSETQVQRLGPRELHVTQQGGFLSRPEETHYRADARSLPVGARVQRAGLTAVVTATTADGRPRSVSFRFDEPLESERYAFYEYRAGELIRVVPPADEHCLRLPATTFFQLFTEEAVSLARVVQRPAGSAVTACAAPSVADSILSAKR